MIICFLTRTSIKNPHLSKGERKEEFEQKGVKNRGRSIKEGREAIIGMSFHP